MYQAMSLARHRREEEPHSGLSTRTWGSLEATLEADCQKMDFADLDLQVSAQRTACFLPDQSLIT